jgi:hypothetical protein
MALSTQSDMDEIMERFYMNQNYKPQGLLQEPRPVGNGLEADGSMIQSIDGQSAGPMTNQDLRTLSPIQGAQIGAGAGPMTNLDQQRLMGAQMGAQLGGMGQGPMSNQDVNTILQNKGNTLNRESILNKMQGSGPMTNKDSDVLNQVLDKYYRY